MANLMMADNGARYEVMSYELILALKLQLFTGSSSYINQRSDNLESDPKMQP
jgi:hypothetical protein